MHTYMIYDTHTHTHTRTHTRTHARTLQLLVLSAHRTVRGEGDFRIVTSLMALDKNITLLMAIWEEE